MYKNIGGKLKGLAKITGIICVIGFILGVVVAIASKTPESISLAVACIAGVISTWPIYGLGQLIENTDKMVEKMK